MLKVFIGVLIKHGAIKTPLFYDNFVFLKKLIREKPSIAIIIKTIIYGQTNLREIKIKITCRFFSSCRFCVKNKSG